MKTEDVLTYAVAALLVAIVGPDDGGLYWLRVGHALGLVRLTLLRSSPARRRPGHRHWAARDNIKPTYLIKGQKIDPKMILRPAIALVCGWVVKELFL